MRFRSSDREEKNLALSIRIVVDKDSANPSRQRVFRLEISDEFDPFLYFALDVSEEDFHVLKTEQKILVDFSTFPLKVIELLDLVISSADEDSPRFFASLDVQPGSGILSVVESNPFRQLTHVALHVRQGNDSMVKRYLASRLGESKVHFR